MPERDRDLERDLLVRAGGLEEFTEQVLARLDHYEAEHGNTGWARPVDELLQEITEECADISGWAIGAAAQLADADLELLVEAMSHGAIAHRKISALRERLSLRGPS
jgi:hypothetical protein